MRTNNKGHMSTVSEILQQSNELDQKFAQKKSELDKDASAAMTAMISWAARENPDGVAHLLADAVFTPTSCENACTEEVCTIDKVFSLLGLEYDVNHSLTFADLLHGLGGREACAILSAAFFAEVSYNGEGFFWQEKSQYASDVVFAVRYDTPITYDDCGVLRNPLSFLPATHIFPKLSHYFGDNQILCCYGKFSHGEENGNFFGEKLTAQATIGDNDAVLLAVYWGGPVKVGTKGDEGLARQQLPGLRAFRSFPSKHGGEGCDYYILSLKDANIETEAFAHLTEYQQKISESMLVFSNKLKLLGVLDKTHKECCEKCQHAYDAMLALYQRCRDNELAKRDFVEMPVFEDFLDVNLDLQSSTKSSLDKIVREIRSLSAVNFDTILSKAEITVDAWERFAPKYAQLHDSVAEKYHGWIQVFGDKTIVGLPSHASSVLNAGLTEEKEFGFSEVSFKLCVDYLLEYGQQEEEAASCSQMTMIKFLQ